jgi:adenine-specific DNA-methyltransferase
MGSEVENRMQSPQLSLFPTIEVPDISDRFVPDADAVLHLGDTYDFLKSVPSDMASLIITSPPYNIGKEYETKTSIEQYLATQENVIGELVRVLADNGSICWEVGNYIENGEVFPLDIYYYRIFKARGLKLRNRIIWHFGHGLHASKRFSGRYETILWFTKSDNYTFNLDPVRVPSKYPGKRHFKGDKKGQPSGNPLGKNPADIWEFVLQEWEKELWDIPNVKSNHPEKTIHPCQFPIELVERCLLALTNEGDWILDPYSGVGSTLVAGLKHKRRVIGVDRDSTYIEVTRERIQALHEGRLQMRELGTAVYEPTGKDSVSRVPDEWKVNGNGNGSDPL